MAGSPLRRPDRPRRWRRLATEGGGPICADALDGADVDAELQRVGADGRGRKLLLLQGSLGLGPNLLRQAAVVRPELVGHLLRLAHLVQQVRVPLHLSTGVREDEVVRPAQALEEVRGNLGRRRRLGLISRPPRGGRPEAPRSP